MRRPLKIPYSVLGIEKNGDSLINLRFKWVDILKKNESGGYEAFTFYNDGDARPSAGSVSFIPMYNRFESLGDT